MIFLRSGGGFFYVKARNTETLHKVCLQLPGTREEIKWEKDLVFTIRRKMYCVTSFEEPFQTSFRVSASDFEDLCARKGFTPASYLARARWVMVEIAAQLSKKEWEAYLEQSCLLVAEKLTKNNVRK